MSMIRKTVFRVPAILALVAGIAMTVTIPAMAEVKVEEVVSPGGITAWLVRDETVPVTAIEFTFKGGGSGHDKPGKEGTARLTASTLDEGAGAYDSKAFQSLLADKSINISFHAGRDSFSGSFYALNRYRDEGLDLLRLALTQPRFDEEPVERIRGQIMVSLKQDATDPGTIAGQALMRTVFGDHPYSVDGDGTLDSVPQVTVDDMRDFMAAAMTKDKLLVGVVGSVTPEELGPILDDVFGALPATGQPDPIPDFTGDSPAGTVVIDMDVPQSTILFSQPWIGLDDPRYYTGMVLNYVLGGGSFSSVLTEEIRIKRGLAYSVYSFQHPMDHANLLRGGSGTDNASVAEAIDLIRQVVSDFQAKGLPPVRIEDAKTYLTGSFPLRFTSSSRIASQLASMQYYDFPITYFETRNSLIEAVTVEDVNKLAADMLKPDQLLFVVVGKPEGLAATLSVPGQ